MELHDTVMGRRFYEGTMPSIAKSLSEIAKALPKLAEKSDKEIEAFAECVFDLTVIAHFLHGMLDEKDSEIDSRAIFQEVFALAKEFQFGKDGKTPYVDEGNYLKDIEEFGQKRLALFFGLA